MSSSEQDELDALFRPRKTATRAERALWTRTLDVVRGLEFTRKDPASNRDIIKIKVESLAVLAELTVMSDGWIRHRPSRLDRRPRGFGKHAARVLRAAIGRAKKASGTTT